MRGSAWAGFALSPGEGQGKPATIVRDKGQRWPRSVRYEALSAGGLQLGTKLNGFLPRAIRPDRRAILDLPAGHIHPLYQRAGGGKHGRVIALRDAERLPRCRLAVLGRNRNHEITSAAL